jgi:2-C-methyl-D-erythritol 2,4-cyclodiphosphate synthase
LRVGIGYDIHRFEEGRRLVIGGVEFPGETGLAGHSDADVLLHVIVDALLGAAALGDIGQHFPPGEPKWKDADSADLLREVVQGIRKVGYEIENIDATIVAERPKLESHKERMEWRIAEVLDIKPEQVNVKAATHEGLGAIGRGEGIAAQAIAMLREASTSQRVARE